MVSEHAHVFMSVKLYALKTERGQGQTYLGGIDVAPDGMRKNYEVPKEKLLAY
jgi:hypothetical protein